MKKFFFFLAIISVSCMSFQCGKDPEVLNTTATLKIRFVSEYDGQALYMDKQVSYVNNLPLKLQRLSLFTQLMNNGSNLMSVDQVDFSNIYDEKTAKEGIVKTISIQEGTYDKLQLGIGVNATDNKKAPSDFSSSNPLSETSEYWSAWDSYIFTKTEGKVDADGSGKFADAFSYHTGTDEMYRTFSFPQSMTFVAGETKEITVAIDVKKIMSGQNGTVNPITEQNAHSLNDKPTALKIMNNYPTAISVR